MKNRRCYTKPQNERHKDERADWRVFHIRPFSLRSTTKS